MNWKCEGVFTRRGALAGIGGGLLAVAVSAPAWSQVTAPAADQNLMIGQTITVTWAGVPGCGTVDIDLYQGPEYIATVADDVANSGSFSWTVADYLLGPACNLRLRAGCPGSEVWSGGFGIEGLLLTSAVAGDRIVTLRWPSVVGDTLGGSRVADDVGRPDEDGDIANYRAFGGYNVWRRTYDNLANPTVRGRFEKVRTYDITTLVPMKENPSTQWDFDQTLAQFGPVEIELDDETTIIDTVALAQTFATPPDSTYDVCNVRVFIGPVFSGWNSNLIIVPQVDGVPDMDTVLGRADLPFGTGGFPSGNIWRVYTFPTPVSLAAGTGYAIVLRGRPSNPSTSGGEFATWVASLADYFEGGTALIASNNGRDEWQEDEGGGDFAFTIGVIDPSDGVGCVVWRGQRRSGDRFREFIDPESIRALVPGEPVDDPDGPGQIIPFIDLDVPGPYNGFQLEYAVTAFDRESQASSNIELPSACEDTLLVDGFPDGVRPSVEARWPEVLYARSGAKTSLSLLSDVYPVPNPYARDVTSESFPRWELPGERRIQFVNLPTRATIKIYSLAGDFIRGLEHEADHGTLNWDLRNGSGEIVTSGVYLWLVETESGERKSGQLVIVR
jgi:hypothetical protein